MSAKYNDDESDIKNIHNMEFMQSVAVSVDTKIFILDGPNNRTAKTLLQNPNIQLSMIHCAERDDRTYQKIKHNNLCIVENTTAESYLKYHKDFTDVYLDFMNTITGNHGTDDLPLETIANLIKNTTKLQTLALTLSARYKYRQEKYSSIYNEYLLRYLVPLFTKYGYEMFAEPPISEYNRSGGQKMLFYLIKLEYSNTVKLMYQDTILSGPGYRAQKRVRFDDNDDIQINMTVCDMRNDDIQINDNVAIEKLSREIKKYKLIVIYMANALAIQSHQN